MFFIEITEGNYYISAKGFGLDPFERRDLALSGVEMVNGKGSIWNVKKTGDTYEIHGNATAKFDQPQSWQIGRNDFIAFKRHFPVIHHPQKFNLKDPKNDGWYLQLADKGSWVTFTNKLGRWWLSIGRFNDRLLFKFEKA